MKLTVVRAEGTSVAGGFGGSGAVKSEWAGGAFGRGRLVVEVTFRTGKAGGGCCFGFVLAGNAGCTRTVI